MARSWSILCAALLPLLSAVAALLFFPVTTGQWPPQEPRRPGDLVLRVYVPQQCGPTVLYLVLSRFLSGPSRIPCGRIWTAGRSTRHKAEYCHLLGEVDHKRYYMHFIHMALASSHLRNRTGVHIEPVDDPFAADVVLCHFKGVARFREDASKAGSSREPLVVIVETTDGATIHTPPDQIKSNTTLAVLKHYAWRGYGGACPRDPSVPPLIGSGRNQWPRLLRGLVASNSSAVPYRRLSFGSSSCPPGLEIASLAECQDALEALLLRSQPSWTGSLASVPSRCSVREGKSPYLHWNALEGGGGRGDLAPVCRREPGRGGRRPRPLTVEEAYALTAVDGCPAPAEEAVARKVFIAVPTFRAVNFGSAFPPWGQLPPLGQRSIDVAFVGMLWEGVAVLHQHRRHLVEHLGAICQRRGWSCVTGASFPAARFRNLLFDVKIFVSPFGLGEFSHKDDEVVLSGAVLMKPAAGILEATIPIYTPNVTCLDVRPDWADLEDALAAALADPRALERIRSRAHEVLRQFVDLSAAVRQPDVVEKYAELVRRAVSSVHG